MTLSVRRALMCLTFRVVQCLTLALICVSSSSAGTTDIKMRIAFPASINGMIAVTMDKAGIAKKHGLDAEFIFFQNGPPMLEAMASDNIDAVIASLQPAASYLSRQPGRALIVADLGHTTHSLLVPKSSPVKDIKDLANKRLAVSFGTTGFLDLRRLLKSAGIDEKTGITLVNSSPSELQSVLQLGLVDAVVASQPQVLRLQEQLGAQIIYSWPFVALSFMSADYVAQHPEARSQYQSALKEAIEFIAANLDQTSAWFSEYLRVDPSIVKQVAMEDSNYRKIKKGEPITVEITPEFRTVMEDWFQASHEFGMIRERIDTTKPYF